jgi:hypothetical protein
MPEIGKSMITKILICDHCDTHFQRTGYPSSFDRYSKTYCTKAHAMIAAARDYRPTQVIIQRPDGRYMVRVRSHPNANKNHQVTNACLVMEKYLGRYLADGEIVHHCDGNCSNDDINNLELMFVGEHRKLHIALQERSKNGQFQKSNER